MEVNEQYERYIVKYYISPECSDYYNDYGGNYEAEFDTKNEADKFVYNIRGNTRCNNIEIYHKTVKRIE